MSVSQFIFGKGILILAPEKIETINKTKTFLCVYEITHADAAVLTTLEASCIVSYLAQMLCFICILYINIYFILRNRRKDSRQNKTRSMHTNNHSGTSASTPNKHICMRSLAHTHTHAQYNMIYSSISFIECRFY